VKDTADQAKKSSEALRGEVKQAVDDQFKQLEGDNK
jgi:DNA-binding protein Fis